MILTVLGLNTLEVKAENPLEPGIHPAAMNHFPEMVDKQLVAEGSHLAEVAHGLNVAAANIHIVGEGGRIAVILELASLADTGPELNMPIAGHSLAVVPAESRSLVGKKLFHTDPAEAHQEPCSSLVS